MIKSSSCGKGIPHASYLHITLIPHTILIHHAKNISNYTLNFFVPGNYFNVKVKVAVLQQGQDWEASQTKDIKLVITGYYIFTASDSIFNALGIHLDKTTRTKSTSPPGTYETSLDTSPSQIIIIITM